MSILPFLFAACLGTATLILSSAMRARPDMRMVSGSQLNVMLTSVLGWAGLALNAVYAIYRFGLIRPALAAAALYAAYRLAVTLDLIPLYPYAVGFGLVSLVTTLLVLAQSF